MTGLRALAACALVALATACGTVPPVPASPTAIVLTVTVSTVTPIPVLTITAQPVPTITVAPTPEPGGYRMRTVRPIPVGEVDFMAWVCHEDNYYWTVYPSGMTLHEDPVGERLCMGLKTL